jgi:hypothetical protein
LKIKYKEFIAACMDKSVYLKEEKLLAAFKSFDLVICLIFSFRMEVVKSHLKS